MDDNSLSDLEVSQIRFFIEDCRLETERVDDVISLFRAIFQRLFMFFGRRVGTFSTRLIETVQVLELCFDEPISTSAPAFTVIIWQSTS